MSVVKINAIDVPEGAGPELEARFAARARSVENSPGFEEFQLLRPTAGESRYFVYTRWDSEESFQAWTAGQSFRQGHAGGSESGSSSEAGADAAQRMARPVSTGATLLAFDVVQHVVKAPGGGSSSSF